MAKRNLKTYLFFNRIIDVLISLPLLIVLSPVLTAVAVLIRITTHGQAIFMQVRVGKNAKVFYLYKFRTMVHDAEKYTGPVLSKHNDERVTKVGRVLRRLRIDELPQLWNVLKGDMSIVGPRPERPYFVAKHKELQGGRLSVNPGLTGMAQVTGHYYTTPKNKWRYEKIYIKRMSLWLDLVIMAKTVVVILTKRGS